MTGFELRIWRKGFGWDQERAAEELGVSLRTYKSYEKSPEITRVVAMATQLLLLKSMLPQLEAMSAEGALASIKNIVNI